jgi:transcription elongation factor GreA
MITEIYYFYLTNIGFGNIILLSGYDAIINPIVQALPFQGCLFSAFKAKRSQYCSEDGGFNMAEQDVLITIEGLHKMEEELEHLKTVRRKEVADRIKQAIEFGDISENSEYEDAKNEQAFIEGSILALEKKLKNARVVDDSDVNIDVVSEYSTVTLLNLDTSEEISYQIVGSVEAKPFEGKISNESPVGKAVLGHPVGSELTVSVPAGELHLRIVSINK